MIIQSSPVNVKSAIVNSPAIVNDEISKIRVCFDFVLIFGYSKFSVFRNDQNLYIKRRGL